MLSKELTPAEIAGAKPFIEKYVKYIKNIYQPKSLYDDISAQMTKKVVTYDLINRLVAELDGLLTRPQQPEGNPTDHGNIIRTQFQQRRQQ